jgi:cyclase
MIRTRLIPVLLLRGTGLVKGKNFKNHKYVGDPINAIKIFNEKEVDELVFLDISAGVEGRAPNFDVIGDIASEAFMPFSYGGGLTSIDQIQKVFSLGVEKVVINSAAFFDPNLIKISSKLAGKQSIVVSIDVKKKLLGGYEVMVANGTKSTNMNPVAYAERMEELGAGELILTSIDREGTGKGYDISLVDQVSRAVDIPVVAVGGAGSVDHLADVMRDTSASAVGAGDLFIFYGKHKAVLITYPSYESFRSLLEKDIPDEQ